MFRRITRWSTTIPRARARRAALSLARHLSLPALAAVTLLVTVDPAGAAAQEPLEARGLEMTREQLNAVLERYNEAASSPGYSRGLREQARREAELIRLRLDEGDFQVGDRIILRIRGPRVLADTLVVEPGRTIQVADFGQIPLAGVLRSELEGHLTRELGKFIRDPEISAESLIRIAVMGQVGRPGFLVLPASMLLEDALMAAGGPAGDADLENMRIERSTQTVWEGAALQDALVQGRTLDQLNLRAGDRIEVPENRPGFFSQGVLRTLLFTLPPLILLATRLGL